MNVNTGLPGFSTARLVQAFASWRLEDIPPEVIERLKLFVIDTLGAIATASEQREVQIVNRRLASWGGRGSATALLGKIALPPPFAALANGTAAHALDFDDIHDVARVHSFAVLLPALLAVAEDRGGVSGSDFLLSLAVGAELNARLGLAAPRTLGIGWHPSTVFGALSAGLSCARLLGLDAQAQTGSLGFAHHLAAGSSESILSAAPSKRIGLGFAAQAGVMAASLAADGISGPAEPLAGRSGLFELQLRGEVEPGALMAELGQRWEILAYHFKPYPCCRCCHSSIALGVSLHREGLAHQKVKRIEIGMSHLNASTVGAPYDPARNSPSHAQFNVAFCFAAALAEGSVGISTFTPRFFSDERLVDLAARTRVSIDPAIAPEAMEPVRVRLLLEDGTEVVRVFSRPDTGFDAETLLVKARKGLSDGLRADAGAVDRLLETALDLENLADIRDLVARFPETGVQDTTAEGFAS